MKYLPAISVKSYWWRGNIPGNVSQVLLAESAAAYVESGLL